MQTRNINKIILSVIILLINPFSSLFSQITDFRNYQRIVNEAELCIVDDKKEDALNLYYNLLLKSDGNFAKDIYNSMLLAQELNRVDTFFVLMELAKKKNFENEYINGLKVFEPMHKHPRWKRFMETNNQIIYVDTALRTKISMLDKNDQYFRQKKGSYTMYGDTIKKIDSTNMAFLLNMMLTSGLPGEKEIGADNFYGAQGYDIVLHHYAQSLSLKKDSMLNITPLLILQVNEGRILPNKCGLYLDYQTLEFKSSVFSVLKFRIQDKDSGIFVPEYSHYRKIFIENNRKLICAEPLFEYYKKVLYKENTREHIFYFDAYINILDTDMDTYLKFKKYYIELK